MKLYPDIEKATPKDKPEMVNGKLCLPLEWIAVYRERTGQNICLESTKELTTKEASRFTSQGMKVEVEFVGDVGCVYQVI